MKRKTLIFLALLLLLPAFQGCLHVEELPAMTENSTIKSYYATENYVYVADHAAAMPSILTSLSPAYLRLVNKTHALSRQDAPTEVVTLPVSLTNYEKEVALEARTATALQAMLREMAAVGIYPKVTSGYRTYAYQESLFYGYLEAERSTITSEARAFLGEEYIYQNYTSRGKTSLSAEDARRVVLSYSAYPGTSEHQTGLCVDFVAFDGAPLDTSFASSDAFRWLSQNAHKFGFVLRFPSDKTAITGYSYEPWHYRFVGREAATDIYRNGLCLEEYLGKTN